MIIFNNLILNTNDVYISMLWLNRHPISTTWTLIDLKTAILGSIEFAFGLKKKLSFGLETKYFSQIKNLLWPLVLAPGLGPTTHSQTQSLYSLTAKRHCEFVWNVKE